MTRLEIDLLGTRSHYLDHLAPLWLDLPDDLRGVVVVPAHLADHAAALGLPKAAPQTRPGHVTLVASYTDERHARGPVLHVEHGAGQAYEGWLNGHPRGRRRRNLEGYLAPGPHAALAWMEMAVGAPAVTIGSARLEQLRARRMHAPRDVGVHPLRPRRVAFAWHWRQTGVPEQATALDHWWPAVVEAAQELDDQGWDVVGHGHPRLWHELEPMYEAAGIATEPDPGRVLAYADVLVADNTSMIWEACALGIPVVLLDNPEWRGRDVDHGLRFWEFADVGPRLGAPFIDGDHLAEAIVDAYDDAPGGLEELDEPWPSARARAAAWVFSPYDRDRAATAIEALAFAATGGDTMPSRHDPFRGHRPISRVSIEPSDQDLRDAIRGYFAFAGVEPSTEQVDAWAAMGHDELVAADLELRELTPVQLRELQIGGVDVTGSAGETDADQWGEPPEDARERVAAIDGDPARARWVLAHEHARPESKQRSTVLDAANAVLGTQPA